LQSPYVRHQIFWNEGTGSTVSNVRIPVLKALKIPRQTNEKAIAHILGTLDDKIELNRRMNETLEAMARAIFKDWFVDFGPTRAKMEGRAAYLPEHIWSLFPGAINDETGLPEGWELATLGYIAESVNRTVNPAEIDEQTPYIGLEHMPRHSIALSDWEGAGKVTSNKLRFETGEFLFGKLRPYFHKVGIAPLSGICSTDIVVVRAKAEIWSSFVLTAISTNNFVEYTNLTSTGTKMPRTSWSIMAKYELTLPPESLVKRFNLMIQPCTSKIIENIHQGRTLAELRDRLLPKLMSGEIRVKEAEKMMEEVM
jgi:type I restriction enzyme S subunit